MFDPLWAMGPDAPLLHPELRSYVGFPQYVPENLRNVCARVEVTRGDPEAGFAAADLVLEHTFRTGTMHQGYLEPQATVVELGGNGRVELWHSNKALFRTKDEMAQILDLPPEDLLFHNISIGGDFGSKGSPGDAPAGYYLARQTGRPVKFVMTSREELTAMTPRHPSVITIKSGVKRDGTLVARDIFIVYNSGAYGAFRPNVMDGMLPGAGQAGSQYATPNLHVDGRMVYTNEVPRGYMRSPGQPQAVFAIEAHTDLLSRALEMDPLEFRIKNAARNADGSESTAPALLRAAAEAIGWTTSAERRVLSAEKDGGPSSTPQHSALSTPHSVGTQHSVSAQHFVGRGLGVASRNMGGGTGSSDITVNPDGTVTVVSSAPDVGTGTLTVVAAVVAESFGIPIERVHLVHGDTDALPNDTEAGASRMTNVAGHTVIATCDQVKEQLAPLAAEMLGAEHPVWDATGWRGEDGRFVELEDLARAMIRPGEPLAHARLTMQVAGGKEPERSVQAAEVEVDAETGQVTVRKLVTAQTVGTIINETAHQGQIEGCLVQGFGYAMTEELTIEEGHVTTGHLGDYKLPTIADVPPLFTVNLLHPGDGPFNAQAIGETPVVPTPAAIANAVADAIGVPVMELPITAERILTLLDGRA